MTRANRVSAQTILITQQRLDNYLLLQANKAEIKKQYNAEKLKLTKIIQSGNYEIEKGKLILTLDEKAPIIPAWKGICEDIITRIATKEAGKFLLDKLFKCSDFEQFEANIRDNLPPVKSYTPVVSVAPTIIELVQK